MQVITQCLWVLARASPGGLRLYVGRDLSCLTGTFTQHPIGGGLSYDQNFSDWYDISKVGFGDERYSYILIILKHNAIDFDPHIDRVLVFIQSLPGDICYCTGCIDWVDILMD